MCWSLLQSLSQLLSGRRPLVSFVYAELDSQVQLLWSPADLASSAEDSPLERIKLINIGIFVGWLDILTKNVLLFLVRTLHKMRFIGIKDRKHF